MIAGCKRALVVAPHPDDEVLGCGGTIARLTEAGSEVHVVIVTRGTSPPFGAAMVEQGRQEAREAHQLLKVAATHFLDFPAAALDRVPHAELNSALAQIVDQHAPDTLLVPFVGDIHLDHQLVFQSVMIAVRPRARRVPAVYAYETLSETNWSAPYLTPSFLPNVYVDISDVLERKLQAMACFTSQLRAFPNERSLEALRALALHRGATVFRDAAEAFVLVREIL